MKKFNKFTKEPSQSKGPAEIEPGYFKPLQVEVGNNFDRAFKTFRSMVQSEQILREYKRRMSFESPSLKKRRKKNEAIRRAYEETLKAEKIANGTFDKEQERKLRKKEQKMKERAQKIEEEKKVQE